MCSLPELYIFFCKRSNCKPNSELIRILEEEGKDVKKLDFSTNYLGPRGAVPALEITRNCFSVESIDLSNNFLVTEAVQTLVNIASGHPALRAINLSNNPLTLEHAYPLLGLLTSNTRICELKLEKTDIVPAMLKRIQEQLEKNRTQSKVVQFENEMQDEIASSNKHKYLRDDAPLTKNMIKGEWKGQTAAGSPHFVSWRDGPQFLLWVEEECNCTIALRQRPKDSVVQDSQRFTYAGLILANGSGVRKVLSLTAKNTVAESKEFSNDETIYLYTTLEKRKKGVDDPYVIVPCTFYPKRETAFQIAVTSRFTNDNNDSTRFIIEEVNPKFDWFSTPLLGSQFTVATAGGSRFHTGWRSNTQYKLQFKDRTRTNTRLFIVFCVAKGEDVLDDATVNLSLCLFNGNRFNRKLLHLNPEDIIAETPFANTATVWLEVELPSRDEGYVIMPCTQTPGQFLDYTLQVFCSCTCTVTKLDNSWFEYSISDNWDTDSNGGSLQYNLISYKHNKAFQLELTMNSDILLLMESEDASAAFKENAFSMGVFIDQQFTIKPFKQSPPVVQGESELFLEQLSCSEKYLIVPWTAFAGDHRSYSVRVYSSVPLRAAGVRWESISPLPGPFLLSSLLEEKESARYEMEVKSSKASVAKRKAAAPVKDEDKQVSNGQPSDELWDSITSQWETLSKPFVDRDFPAGESSVYIDVEVSTGTLPIHEWKRWNDTLECPTLYPIGDFYKLESGEGKWSTSFLNAFAVVAHFRKGGSLIRRVSDAAGAIDARFFNSSPGQWRSEVIDTYLPHDFVGSCLTSRMAAEQSCYLLPALEKAYAKHRGSYEAISCSKEADCLSDLTGCIVQEFDLRSPDNKKKTTGYRPEFWSKMQIMHQKGDAMALFSHESVATVNGNHMVGLLYNRFYIVVDIREVFGYRLLQLKNHWDEEWLWKGKFSESSAQWNADIEKSLGAPFERSTFWIEFSDAMFHFSHLFVTLSLAVPTPGPGIAKASRFDKSINGEWDAGIGNAGGPLTSPTWVKNKQYSFEVSGAKGSTVAVIVSLSQPHSKVLSAVHRDRVFVPVPPRASYHKCGLFLFNTESNSKKVADLGELIGEPTCLGWGSIRDNVAELQLIAGNKYILMACTESPNVSSPYTIRIMSDTNFSLSLIPEEETYFINGEWSRTSSGGQPSYGTWRLNPQFCLEPLSAGKYTVALDLVQESAGGKIASSPPSIGFIVLRGKTLQRLLNYSPADIVCIVPPQDKRRVCCTIDLQTIHQTAGQPYVVIPFTDSPNQFGAFRISVSSNCKLRFNGIDPDTDWSQQTVHGEWRRERGCSGGCLSYGSWRENRQYFLHFPDKTATVSLMLSKSLPTEQLLTDTNEMTFILVKGSQSQGGRRRRLAVESPDVLLEVKGSADHIFGEIVLPYNVHGYFIIPSTRYPDVELDFSLTAYTSCDVTLAPLKPEEDWNVSELRGCWKAGFTSGGCRGESAAWLNNPFFTMKFQHTANVVIALAQLPKSVGIDMFTAIPNNLAGDRMRTKKTLKERQFTTYDRKGNIAIGLDLCVDDDQQRIRPSHVVQSEITSDSEVVLSLPRLHHGVHPYLIVPFAKDPEEEADFIITVYSDVSGTIEPVEKAKRPFDVA